MSATTATQRASAMYERAKDISSGKIDLEVSGKDCDGYHYPWSCLRDYFINRDEYLFRV